MLSTQSGKIHTNGIEAKLYHMHTLIVRADMVIRDIILYNLMTEMLELHTTSMYSITKTTSSAGMKTNGKA